MSTSNPHNSILNLINPYASVNRSAVLSDPISPSTLLLRELTGDDDEEGSHSQVVPGSQDRRSSPTTPTRRRASHVISNSSSSSDEEAPPRSLLYGETSGSASRRSSERTPRSPQASLPSPQQTVSFSHGMTKPTSPGPFRAPSSSTSESRSRSTSPGPSSISIYASGLEGTALNSSLAQSSSRDISASSSRPAAASSRVTPTFREHPRPGPPPRTASTLSAKRSPPRLSNGSAYLDPQIPPSKDKKGKGKAKHQGGKKYVAVATQDADDEEDEPRKGMGRYAGFATEARGGKTGLDEHEKALWHWVNVDDLDGFLQEVGQMQELG